MSERNVEVVRSLLEPFQAINTAEVDWGADAVREALAAWLEPFSEFHSTWIEFIDAGDFVLVPNSHWGLGKGSGAEAEIEMAYACEVKDGLITRLLQYDTLEDAERAIASGA